MDAQSVHESAEGSSPSTPPQRHRCQHPGPRRRLASRAHGADRARRCPPDGTVALETRSIKLGVLVPNLRTGTVAARDLYLEADHLLVPGDIQAVTARPGD